MYIHDKSTLFSIVPVITKRDQESRRGRQRMRQLDSVARLSGHKFEHLWEIVKDRGTWCAAVHGMAKS